MRRFLKRVSLIYLFFWLALMLIWQLGGFHAEMNTEGEAILNTPSWKHFFGTDALGRSLAGRILEGGFVSFIVCLFSSLLSLVLSIFFGVVWTWLRPRDTWVLTLMDLLQALPAYVISTMVFLTLQAFFQTPQGAMGALVTALAVTHWMNPARILRAQTLQLHYAPYVEATRGLGATGWHILRTHVPPHLKNTILVLWALQIPILLMYESFMSFIGFGVEAPYTSWGQLLQEGWRYLSDYPHLLLGPGFVLFTVLLALNYLMDSWRYSGLPEGKMEPPKADSKALATEMER